MNRNYHAWRNNIMSKDSDLLLNKYEVNLITLDLSDIISIL
jgi:hypothetical protein